MATELLTVTNDPVQITDGTNSAMISLVNAPPLYFADSDGKPTDLRVGDRIRDRLIIHPPVKIWIWSPWDKPAEVAITKWSGE